MNYFLLFQPADRILIDYSKDDYRDMFIKRETILSKKGSKQRNKSPQIAKII